MTFGKNKSMGNKGQMFLIAAIVIVSSIVILKFNMASPSATRQIITMKARFEGSIFENMMNELNNTLRFSADVPTNITDNMFDFANFTETKINSRSLKFKMVYVGSISNYTTNAVNSTVINMMDDAVDVSITLNGVTEAKDGLADYGTWETNITVSPGTTYTMTFVHGSSTESITIKTKKKKDVYTGYFYVVLESEYATHINEWTKTFNL